MKGSLVVCLFYLLCGQEDCSASPAAIIALRSVCSLGNKVNDKAVLRTLLLPYLWVFVSKLPYLQIQQKPLY